MALNYEIDNKLKALSPVVDEYADWYAQVIARAFYPEVYKEEAPLEFPEQFKNWLYDIREDEELVAKETQARLLKQHDELHESVRKLLELAKTRPGRPERTSFEDFSSRYDEFIAWLRRVERDAMQAGSGLDPLTGLRSPKAMEHDLAREMERRSRRGKPFCIALARIDHYERVSKIQSDEEHKKMIKTIADITKKCIRSFDDAYRATDSEFILSLKQASIVGGNAAIERMKRFMIEAGLTVMDEGKEFPITMSYCIAEPAPGDNVLELMDNMRSDLERYEDEGGGNTSLEYMELSPLRRYINDIEDTQGGHA